MESPDFETFLKLLVPAQVIQVSSARASEPLKGDTAGPCWFGLGTRLF